MADVPDSKSGGARVKSSRRVCRRFGAHKPSPPTARTAVPSSTLSGSPTTSHRKRPSSTTAPATNSTSTRSGDQDLREALPFSTSPLRNDRERFSFACRATHRSIRPGRSDLPRSSPVGIGVNMPHPAGTYRCRRPRFLGKPGTVGEASCHVGSCVARRGRSSDAGVHVIEVAPAPPLRKSSTVNLNSASCSAEC